MQKVLAGGVSSNSALANTLQQSANIKAFRDGFRFRRQNGEHHDRPRRSSTMWSINIPSRRWRRIRAQQNPGVQLALYFKERAPSLTSVYGILADSKILTVVQTALRHPSSSTSSQSIDTQYRLLSMQVNISDFQVPRPSWQQFISRFAAKRL